MTYNIIFEFIGVIILSATVGLLIYYYGSILLASVLISMLISWIVSGKLNNYYD